MLTVPLSLYVPVAVNCWVEPFVIDGFAGVTAIETSVAGVTVRTVVPVLPLSVALMLLVPVATPVASPPLVIVATESVAEAHVTWLVILTALLSLNVPVAVNCWVAPLVIEGLAGVTAIDTSVVGVTVNTVEPVTPFSTALMLLVPVATPVARPLLVIVATESVAEAHVT